LFSTGTPRATSTNNLYQYENWRLSRTTFSRNPHQTLCLPKNPLTEKLQKLYTSQNNQKIQRFYQPCLYQLITVLSRKIGQDYTIFDEIVKMRSFLFCKQLQILSLSLSVHFIRYFTL